MGLLIAVSTQHPAKDDVMSDVIPRKNQCVKSVLVNGFLRAEVLRTEIRLFG